MIESSDGSSPEHLTAYASGGSGIALFPGSPVDKLLEIRILHHILVPWINFTDKIRNLYTWRERKDR